MKAGGVQTLGREQGFPYLDDPRSAAGPTMLIAKVQHTPGVVCMQDVSAVMKKRGTKYADTDMNAMLSHSSYPGTYSVTGGKGGESQAFQDRYNTK